MAKSKINDYVLEIGWDGRQVNRGITQLEKRINKLAKAAERLNKASQMGGGKARPIPTRAPKTGGLLGQEIINDRKLTMLKVADDKVRSLKKTLMNLDMGAKGADGARKSLEANLRAIEAYKAKLKGMTITTRSELSAQRQAWIRLNGSIEDSRMKILHANKSLGFLKTTIRGAAKSFGTAAIAAVGAYAVIGGVKALYNAGKEWENLTIQMQASFGSAEAGAERMDFLIKKSQELGVDVNALADGYAKIGVAARMSNVPTADSENIFLAAAESSRAFGLSMDDTQGVMRAFSQMMGKGQVMMEELKLQLGDRMPSAMGIFAKSMGKTMPQFIQLVKEGKVGNKELANFATYLRKDIRESGAYQKSLVSLEAAQTRFNTALNFAGTSFMGGQMKTALVDLYEIFTSFLNDTKEFWGLIGDILGFIINVGGYLLKMVLNPIAKVLKGIGQLWSWLKDTSITKKEDVKNLNLMERSIRFIYLLWIDVLNVIDYVGDKIEKLMELLLNPSNISLFGDDGKVNKEKKADIAAKVNNTGSNLDSIRKSMLEKDASVRSVTQAYRDRMKAKDAATAARLEPNRGMTVKGDVVVNIPKGTPPSQAREMAANIAQSELSAQLPTSK